MPWVSQKASCTGDSSPGPGVTPSMVVMAEPSAWAANIRQERTATPSNSTVQAPRTPCSQPAWAPVSASWSRRQSSRVVRGSTSSSRTAPLTLSLMRMGFFPLRVGACVGNGAGGETGRDPTAVFGRGVQIAQWVDIGERLGHGGFYFRGVESAAFQLVLGAVESHGKIGDGADADG